MDITHMYAVDAGTDARYAREIRLAHEYRHGATLPGGCYVPLGAVEAYASSVAGLLRWLQAVRP